MKHDQSNHTRRTFLKIATPGALALALPAPLLAWQPFGNDFPAAVAPFPLEAVRLEASPFRDAVEANRAYLHRIEPDRLLHNFRQHAGLPPKGESYGGWERDTIAGHTLGHYLTACALMHAQTGDEECKKRAAYIVSELAACQAAAGDGYVAGFTRRRGEAIENGRVIFDELARGEIRVASFDLNGGWVPFYNWHKLFAGLFDVQEHCGNSQALPVVLGLAGFIDGVFAKLDDPQLQKVLDCEHGGINESFAELYARTQDKRWLALAERIRHRRMLDPMAAQTEALTNNHANTQIPKVIGLARLYELTGKPEYATAARFFWQSVTTHHTYVIGGNSDREYFQAPLSISKYITEQTCESCNTYNMLKLTRHLFQWNPNGAYGDYYERAHYNHILAHQNPKTGMFAYMIPLMSGTARAFSRPFDDFWCCVGSGMESHAKHGDSIYWHSDDHLLVNLFIPSTLSWQERGADFALATGYPFTEEVKFTVSRIAKPAEFTIALRIPGWCAGASLKLNGKRVKFTQTNGFATLRRRWQTGDTIALTLPLKLRVEPTPDDANVVALLRGPLVLAADLGPADKPFDGREPALVGADVLASLVPQAAPAAFRTKGTGRPQDLELKPFYAQWERRTAIYFHRYTDAQWAQRQSAVAAELERFKDLESRTVDLVKLGEREAERAHELASKISYPVEYRWRKGRDARSNGYFEFTAKVSDVPLTLRATYWGGERKRTFHILVDGARIATQKLDFDQTGAFIDRDYPLPPELTKGKASVVIRFEPEPGHTAGPVFGCRLFAPGQSLP